MPLNLILLRLKNGGDNPSMQVRALGTVPGLHLAKQTLNKYFVLSNQISIFVCWSATKILLCMYPTVIHPRVI